MVVSPGRVLAAAVLLAAPLALASCATGEDGPGTPAAGACPGAVVDVVVSVDQWGDIVDQLGGECARVRTLVAGSSADPHDYEPSPADAAAFGGAQLVVINGGHYDEWAAKLAATSAPDATVVDAVRIGTGAAHDHEHGHEHVHGDNQHVWYDPHIVVAVADEVTDRLSSLSPDAGGYFEARRAEFGTALQPYQAAIAAIRAGAEGKTFAATENLFDPMAETLGLVNLTPPGYQTAASNEADPSPADLDAFLTLLEDRGVDVLLVNTQTEGAVHTQLRRAGEAAGVPLVEVTETLAPGAESFQAWQLDQLTALGKALGVDV